MFAINGRLKVSLLVVGVLVVGLGIYGAFQVQEATANNSSSSCLIKIDKISATVLTAVHYDGYTGNERWSSPTTCYVCAGFYPPAKHREAEYKKDYNYYDVWKHRWPWSTSYDHCHTHYYSNVVEITWYIQPCQQWGG